MLNPGSSCRLCGSAALSHRFQATIMDRREIDYFFCDGCGSLQTEQPTWLDEAYSLHLGSLDTGAVQRNLDNAMLCLLAARLWKLTDAIDWGGGDGMLTRLVRDYGVNCLVSDKYASPVYAQGFSEPDFDRPQMLFSFEVLEHFDRPDEQLEAVFGKRPDLALISTGIYYGQGAQWPYLSLKSGRHVFFYGPKAMRLIAAKYGYSALILGQYILFLRDDVPRGWRLRLFRLFARRSGIRLLRALFLVRRPFGAGRDLAALKTRDERPATAAEACPSRRAAA